MSEELEYMLSKEAQLLAPREIIYLIREVDALLLQRLSEEVQLRFS